MISLLKRLEALTAWPGRIAGAAVPVMILSVCVGLLMVQMKANTLFGWDTPIVLFGDRLTMNSMIDLQWHLFAVMVMLGIVHAMHTDGHVCVDFLASRFSPRTRRIVTLIGDLTLLMPFALVMTWFSWRFALSAWNSGEGSSYGGLHDRWIVKSVMPLGFGLLALFGAVRILRITLELVTGRAREK